MTDESIYVEVKAYWSPTRASAERITQMQLEFSLNHYPPKGGDSIAEIAWSTGSVEQAMAELPSFVPEQVREICRSLLQPWPEGRYTEAYGRCGGILNLYTPPWGEPEDEAWAAMLAGWQQARFADEQSRQEALQALEQRWNHTPHPFWAGLTPAQVLVGGGRREAELAEEFLARLKETYDGHGFSSDGDALQQTLLLLRGWQVQPRGDGLTPQEIILAERDELLARRTRALQQAGRADP